MELSQLRKEKADEDVVISARLDTGHDEITLWYSLPARFADYAVTDAYDSFVLAALPLAMRAPQSLVVRGQMSEKLFHDLAPGYMTIFHLANSRYLPIAVVPDSLVGHRASPSPDRGAVTGFSGGVDSLYTLQRYTRDGGPASYRLKYLMFNNVGGNGQKTPEESKRIFAARYRGIAPVAEELGLEMVRVDSNLSSVLREISFPETHTLRNVSVALLLQPIFSKVLYSSGLPYSEQGFRNPAQRFHDYVDSQTVHLLGTERTECVLVGAEGGRIEKLEALSDFPPAHKYLNVCINLRTADPGANCCACEKCLRTLTILEAQGNLQKFERVFDLQEYQRRRTRHIILNVLGRPDDVSYKRILRYRQKRGLNYSLADRAAGSAVRLLRRLTWAASVALGGKQAKRAWQELEGITRPTRRKIEQVLGSRLGRVPNRFDPQSPGSGKV